MAYRGGLSERKREEARSVQESMLSLLTRIWKRGWGEKGKIEGKLYLPGTLSVSLKELNRLISGARITLQAAVRDTLTG